MKDDNNKPQTQKPFTLRTHRPGDIGWITHRHGILYATEYNFSERFEAVVARISADFIDNYDPLSERCWIAESTSGSGEYLGSVMLVNDRDRPRSAKIRLLLVEPSARGMGVGRGLVRKCIQFSRQANYERIALLTTSFLAPAKHIYHSEGFRMVKEEEHETFGRMVMGEFWELELGSSTTENKS
jgi:GNAT superfamily N-acetyltransferase